MVLPWINSASKKEPWSKNGSVRVFSWTLMDTFGSINVLFEHLLTKPSSPSSRPSICSVADETQTLQRVSVNVYSIHIPSSLFATRITILIPNFFIQKYVLSPFLRCIEAGSAFYHIPIEPSPLPAGNLVVHTLSLYRIVFFLYTNIVWIPGMVSLLLR